MPWLIAFAGSQSNMCFTGIRLRRSDCFSITTGEIPARATEIFRTNDTRQLDLELQRQSLRTEYILLAYPSPGICVEEKSPAVEEEASLPIPQGQES